MKIAVKTLDNKAAGDITLDESVFGVDVRTDILHQMVTYQLAKRRAGTHATQSRGDITRTGKKPFKQKGTGSARAGDKTRNIDRGGQVAHGPTPRSHATELPKKIRQLAMKSALSAKAKDGKLIIVDVLEPKDHKTKAMAEALKAFGVESALIVGGKEIDAKFARATRNIPRIDVLPAQGANVYDILRRDTLVLSKDAVNDLTERLKG
ncbi:MAG: 50S ribosomal protein L4 [Micavibrio sp.]